jgi:uncharacterized protein (UPF0548 family)
MPLFRRPTSAMIGEFLQAQAKRDFSYAARGATASALPAGYVVDHTCVQLGEGEKVFAAAVAALRRWEHFRLDWVETWPRDAPLETGTVVAVLARILALWWLNACRIVYVVNDEGPIRRFGFAYGTLPGHAESGEERFLIEWDQAKGRVWYDILAFSRPRHFLVRCGYPYARRLQKRFGRDSAAAMVRAVARPQVVPGGSGGGVGI